MDHRYALLVALCLAATAAVSQLPVKRGTQTAAVRRPSSATPVKHTAAAGQPAVELGTQSPYHAEQGALLPSRLRILIILRGISYDSKYRDGANNFDRTCENFHSHMVEPWRKQGHSVDVGISTYDGEKLQRVREVYSPVFLYTPGVPYSERSRTKLDSLIEGLQAAEDAGGAKRWDFIAVTRFDLEMREPITQFSIDFGKINFPWPEKNWNDEPFEELPRVGDGMQLFNSAYLGALLEGFRNMAQLARLVRSNSSYNNGHRILTVMDVDVCEDVHFMLNQTFMSIWMRSNPIYRESVPEVLVAVQPGLRDHKSLPKVGNPPVHEHRQPRFRWPKPHAPSWVSKLDPKTIQVLKGARQWRHLQRIEHLKRIEEEPATVAKDHEDLIDSLMNLGVSNS